MDGLLLIDKPSGWTSFDVVAKVRGVIKHETGQKRPKVGHTGTLDPLATGLLVLCLGSYCKRAQEFSKLDKTYEVVMRLGQTSTTGDEEGEKIFVSDTHPSIEELQQACKEFTGEIEQVPPAYSAVKVNGQRAYKMARAGKEVVIEPRKIMVHRLEITDYSYPDVRLVCDVSSGTYIRTLAEDIGKHLGSGAYTADLRRTRVGTFSVQDSISLENIADTTIKSALLDNT